MSTGSVGPAVVALGGGHGLAATLSAVRLMSDRLTAVVTVADDGGSSGRLRDELGVLPPGDLRMALAALCDDSDWGRTWRDLLQHRFRSSGDLDQHAVGNLLIVALWEQLGDTVAGLDWVGRLLGARGRVLPMAAVPLAIEADVLGPAPDEADGTDGAGETRAVGGGTDVPGAADAASRAGRRRVVHGQSAVAVARGRIEQVRLVPPDPPACPEAVAAIEAADWVVLGPGSWFTSVLPHLLVPEIAAALHRTSARRCVTLNLSPEEEGETAGMTATEHLQVLHQHAPDLRIDAVVADPRAVEDVGPLVEAARAMGARLLLRQVRTGDGTPRHDPLRLAAAFRDVFDDFLGDVGTPAH
ncbi:2-phospho-L-lactate transferase CofD family protein [uncultured Cellulomonas sp.]|uniref:gluconeogenesis factor YvcK family protein n=1 Tax=uncultured Cellulomonas sp. TaxID=189682 RepID=UPI002611D040|nr:2-phospho-L-lactate transferase CofD family protein [uncultured Cellulomonas sp.]